MAPESKSAWRCSAGTSQAIEPAFDELHAQIMVAPSVHADETGFGHCGKNRMWLWVGAAKDIEVFRLLAIRSGDQLKGLLGEDFSGKLHHDQWKPYEQLKKAIHQICWSHLRRDIQAMLETLGEMGVQGAMLKLTSDEAFHHWHAFEDGVIERPELIRKMKSIREEIEQRLTRIRDGSERDFTKKARGSAGDILRLKSAL